MVAEVEAVEAALLAEERDDGAAGPVHALAEHLLDVELVLADGDAVHELLGAKPVAIRFTRQITRQLWPKSGQSGRSKASGIDVLFRLLRISVICILPQVA